MSVTDVNSLFTLLPLQLFSTFLLTKLVPTSPPPIIVILLQLLLPPPAPPLQQRGGKRSRLRAAMVPLEAELSLSLTATHAHKLTTKLSWQLSLHSCNRFALRANFTCNRSLSPSFFPPPHCITSSAQYSLSSI